MAAGEPWDDLVRCAVTREWAGLECLSGIPGRVGATPIQNVGAYGQEVSDTISAVHALDRRTGDTVSLAPSECAFAYRDSRFKSGEPDRWIVVGVTYRLRPGGAPAVKYDELARHLAARGLDRPKLGEVRESVIEIRRVPPKNPLVFRKLDSCSIRYKPVLIIAYRFCAARTPTRCRGGRSSCASSTVRNWPEPSRTR